MFEKRVARKSAEKLEAIIDAQVFCSILQRLDVTQVPDRLVTGHAQHDFIRQFRQSLHYCHGQTSGDKRAVKENDKPRSDCSIIVHRRFGQSRTIPHAENWSIRAGLLLEPLRSSFVGQYAETSPLCQLTPRLQDQFLRLCGGNLKRWRVMFVIQDE